MSQALLGAPGYVARRVRLQTQKCWDRLPVPATRVRHAACSRSCVCTLSVDKRRVLEERWSRQKALEADDELASRSCPASCVADLRDLEHLERLCSDLGDDGLVLVYFYLSSCGVCKYVLPAVEDACKRLGACGTGGLLEDGAPGPRVVIAKHSLRDERDDASDLGRLYRIKTAPSFAIFQGGTLLDAWSGGSRQKLYATLDKHMHRHSN